MTEIRLSPLTEPIMAKYNTRVLKQAIKLTLKQLKQWESKKQSAVTASEVEKK